METETPKARLAQALVGVEGWLIPDEAWALHEAVRNLTSEIGPVTVVEIGSWKGRSTIALALGAKARGSGTVFAIDPHTGAPGHTAAGPIVTANEFRENIAAAGVGSSVKLLLTTSHDARPQFDSKSVDILFIDGSHRYEDVKTDITDWETALKDEALVAFNDPSAPGVYSALREVVIRPRTAYRRPALVLNTVFFEFSPFQPWKIQDALALMRLRTVLELRFHATRFRTHLPDWLVPRWLAQIGNTLFSVMVGLGSGAKASVREDGERPEAS